MESTLAFLKCIVKENDIPGYKDYVYKLKLHNLNWGGIPDYVVLLINIEGKLMEIYKPDILIELFRFFDTHTLYVNSKIHTLLNGHEYKHTHKLYVGYGDEGINVSYSADILQKVANLYGLECRVTDSGACLCMVTGAGSLIEVAHYDFKITENGTEHSFTIRTIITNESQSDKFTVYNGYYLYDHIVDKLSDYLYDIEEANSDYVRDQSLVVEKYLDNNNINFLRGYVYSISDEPKRAAYIFINSAKYEIIFDSSFVSFKEKFSDNTIRRELSDITYELLNSLFLKNNE